MYKKILDFFDFKGHNTDFKKEFMAGVTTFFAVVYIIAVNSSILSDAGIPREAAVISTILASSIGSIIIAFYSNTPLIMIPGMGVNTLFTYTLVNNMGLSWQSALGTVVMSGLIFTITAFTPLGNILKEAIPDSLKDSITVGIGLLLTVLGLQKSGIIDYNSALGDFSTLQVQVSVLILIIGIILFVKNIPGNFLLTIIIGTVISIITGINTIDLSSGFNFSLQGYSSIFMKFSFEDITKAPFWIGSISLAMVLIFSNIGVINAFVSGMLKSPEKFNSSYKANALSALSCGFLGTSPTVTAAENAAGIAAGGKTGFTALTAGILFIMSIPIIPFIKLIPDNAVAPIFIIIGYLMLQSIKSINFQDMTEGIPAFFTLALIPFSSDIVNGMAFGFILYPILKLITGKRSKINPTLYVTALLFCIYFILKASF
ncbi:NCS2 family permease [Clostridium polynesiense]|uniref:NCS2 family permease n=1 Tax=Clostridium polynesiense TaxID=1325933 RepID=UPI00058CDF3B|nr:NCS2 family permease [Clostridium polynesiense]